MTTIQIGKAALQMLKELKKRTKAKSYEEVIRKLAESKLKVPSSMFGKHPEMKSFTAEEEADFNGL
jgi:predicted CopG family antitoxin